MHMMWASLSGSMKDLQLTAPMYCATSLLHKGHNMALLKRAIHQAVDSNLIVVFDPVPDNSAVNGQVVALLDAADREYLDIDPLCTPDEITTVVQRRRAARQRLLRVCPGRWSDPNDFRHVCSYEADCGCTSRSDSVKLVCDLIEECCLQCRPSIPAVNRWNKLYGPLAWWTFAVHFHFLIARAFAYVKDQVLDTDSVAGVISVVDLVAPDEQNETTAHRAVKTIRWTKAVRWLSHLTTPRSLASGCLIMLPALKFMGRAFADARVHSKSDISCWVVATSSPAEATLRELTVHMRDMFCTFWFALTKALDWTNAALHSTATITLSFMSGLALRCIFNFRLFPWPLAKLPMPETDVVEADTIEGQLEGMNPCCPTSRDGFSLGFRRWASSKGGIRSPAGLSLIKDSFECCPSSNIRIEDRFARCRKHNSWYSGKASRVSVVGANHMLSEFALMHRAARELHQRNHPFDLDLPEEEQAAGLNSWLRFVQLKSAPGVSLRCLADRWALMSVRERQAVLLEEARPRRVDRVRPDLAQLPPEASPLGIGDDLCPVRPNVSEGIRYSIQPLSTCWEKTVGKSVPATQMDFAKQESYGCFELYGRCKETMTRDEAATRNDCWGLLKAVARFDISASMAIPATCASFLPLMLFCPHHVDEREPILVLRGHALKNPAENVFVRCAVDTTEVRVGSKVLLLLGAGSTSFLQQQVASQMLFEKHRGLGFAVHLVQYRFLTLVELEVLGFTDVTRKLWERPQRARNVVKDVTTILESRKRARPDTRNGPSGTRASRRQGAAAGDDGDAAFPQDAPAENADSQDDAGSDGCDIDEAAFPQDVPAEHAEEVAADFENEPHDDDVVPADLLDVFNGNLRPRWDPITCQVTLNGDILGRIKEMRSGEASAAVSVYCRRHGCTAPLTRTHKAPAVDDILAWFEAGQDLPPGADSRPQHVAMYRELLRRKRYLARQCTSWVCSLFAVAWHAVMARPVVASLSSLIGAN